MSLPVNDLECPVCCDIFIDPVLLSCSHSFCRECVRRCWETSGSRECPMCRKRAPKASPTTNLALRNLCETLQEAQKESSSTEEKEKVLNCDLHAERLKLFCLVDKQPICVVCHMSKTHKNHDCSTMDEAVVDCKVRPVGTEGISLPCFDCVLIVAEEEKKAKSCTLPWMKNVVQRVEHAGDMCSSGVWQQRFVFRHSSDKSLQTILGGLLFFP